MERVTESVSRKPRGVRHGKRCSWCDVMSVNSLVWCEKINKSWCILTKVIIYALTLWWCLRALLKGKGVTLHVLLLILKKSWISYEGSRTEKEESCVGTNWNESCDKTSWTLVCENEQKSLVNRPCMLPLCQPFTVVVAGPTGCGKTAWVLRLIDNVREKIEPVRSRIWY